MFGEDPTVRPLEEMAAERLGKEAGLFVASGTMGNLVSQLTHCGRGDEMILGDQAHIFSTSRAASAALGGIHPRTVPNQPDGHPGPGRHRSGHPTGQRSFSANAADHPRKHPQPLQRQPPGGGLHATSVGQLATPQRAEGARGRGTHFQCRGGLGVEAQTLAEPADSISFCLSKGLAAPVGSLVCGTPTFIAEARRARKVLGGGMRQAGVLAAAGIVALTEMIDAAGRRSRQSPAAGRGPGRIKGHLHRSRTRENKHRFLRHQRDDLPADRLSAALAAEGIHVLPTGKRGSGPSPITTSRPRTSITRWGCSIR